jgi:hypothetical protein
MLSGMKTTKEKDPYMQMMGARGGKRTAQLLTPRQRRERALKAATARWNKKAVTK